MAFTVVLLLLLVAGGAGVAGSLAASRPAPPSSPRTPEAARLVQATPPRTGDPGERARDLQRTLRTERLRRGEMSVPDQVAKVAKETNQELGQVRESGTAIVSLATPMPFDVFEEDREAGRLPMGVQTVTLYLELPDGYPIQVTGRPGDDLAGNLDSFMATLTQRQATNPGKRETTSGETSGASETANNAADLTGARQTLRQLAVILGFTMAPATYERLEEGLHKSYRIATVEVTPGGGAPFKVVEAAVDSTHVSQWRETYRSER